MVRGDYEGVSWVGVGVFFSKEKLERLGMRCGFVKNVIVEAVVL